jgi:hypothetical protein
VSLTWTGRKTTSHLYYTTVWRYSCTQAKRYMKHFISMHSPGAEGKIAGGPKGFVCRSLTPEGYTAFQGICERRTRRSPARFVWLLKQT